MTKPADKPEIKQKIVLVIDVCSSSEIMEDLLKRGEMIKLRDLLINFKDNLAEASEDLGFDLYKFTGDGWILFFDSNFSVAKILSFLSTLSKKFESDFEESIYRYLESPPDLIGLTFGMDSGALYYIEMLERNEWVGRAINIACRLQGTLEDTDILMGYSVMISNNLFQLNKNELDDFSSGISKT